MPNRIRFRRPSRWLAERRDAIDEYSLAVSRPLASVWPLIQAAMAGTLAWVIARHLVGNHEPFFAPIAAVVALNQPLGERGSNGIRILLGVVLGIVVGEIVVSILGSGYVSVGVAMFTAMTVAHYVRGTRLVIIQASSASILTVAAAGGSAGPDRLTDALIGVGVALVFTQLLFSPDPVALLRKAERAVLEGLAEAMALVAQSLESGNPRSLADAIASLRSLRDRLAELSRLRTISGQVARRSPVWRSRKAPIVRETENAGHLDLLAGSSLIFGRRAAFVGDAAPPLARAASELAEILAELSDNLEDHDARQRTANRTLDTTRTLAGALRGSTGDVAAALAAFEMVAADVMTFAGVDATQAHQAVRARTAEFDVRPPPKESPGRLPRLLRRLRRVESPQAG